MKKWVRPIVMPLIMILLYFVIFGGLLQWIIDKGNLTFDKAPYFISYMLGFASLLLINFIYKKTNLGSILLFPRRNNDGRQRFDKLTFFIGLLYTFAFVVIIGLLEFWVDGDKNGLPTLHFLFRSPSSYLLGMMSIAIQEEVFIRSGIQHSIGALTSRKKGLIITSIIFGLFHFLNFINSDLAFNASNLFWIINIMFAGILLGYLYIRYGLIITILFHWIWNASWYKTMMEMEKSFFLLPLVIFSIWSHERYFQYITQKRLAFKENTLNIME